MNHEIVSRHLKTMGFEVEEVPDFATLFHYEGLTFAAIWEDDDEHFLRLALPKIFDVTDDNRISILTVVNEVNLRVKYTKICVSDNSVWVYYEHYFTLETDGENVLEHAIRLLQATLFEFNRIIDGGLDDDADSGETDDAQE